MKYLFICILVLIVCLSCSRNTSTTTLIGDIEELEYLVYKNGFIDGAIHVHENGFNPDSILYFAHRSALQTIWKIDSMIKAREKK